MDKINYMLYYKDDYNHKHLTFVKSYKDIKFYQRRYGEDNVEIESCNFTPPKYDEERGSALSRYF